MVMLLITTEPLALITTGKFLSEEFRIPSTNLISRPFADPFALPPDVATFRLQRLTRTDCRHVNEARLFLHKKLADGGLLGQVQFGVGAGDKIGVPLRLERSHNG